jgi:hypothetical protein
LKRRKKSLWHFVISEIDYTLQNQDRWGYDGSVGNHNMSTLEEVYHVSVGAREKTAVFFALLLNLNDAKGRSFAKTGSGQA